MIPQQRILETAEKLRPEIRNMANAISEGYKGDAREAKRNHIAGSEVVSSDNC